MDRFYEEDKDPCLCRACAERLDMEMEIALPVTNSPRMGVCGYEGELDHYGFEEYAKRDKK